MLHYVSGFRRNDGKRTFSTFYETIKIHLRKIVLSSPVWERLNPDF